MSATWKCRNSDSANRLDANKEKKWEKEELPMETSAKLEKITEQPILQDSPSMVPTDVQFDARKIDTILSIALMLLPPLCLLILTAISCTSRETGTERLSRSLATANASGMISTQMVSGLCGATDIEDDPSRSIFNSPYLGVGINGAVFCSAREEERLGFGCILLLSLCLDEFSAGDLPLLAVCLDVLCFFMGTGKGWASGNIRGALLTDAKALGEESDRPGSDGATSMSKIFSLASLNFLVQDFKSLLL